jgi:hypothetical protein
MSAVTGQRLRTHEYKVFHYPVHSGLDDRVNELLDFGWEILATQIDPGNFPVHGLRGEPSVYLFCKRPRPGYCHICYKSPEEVLAFTADRTCSECGRGRSNWLGPSEPAA